MKLSTEEKKFFEWIRKQPCAFRGNIDPFVFEKKPQFCDSVWNMEKGEWVSEVSHIMRKGSTRRNEHIGNVFPNCRAHHLWFEKLKPYERKTFMDVGQEYWEYYLTNKTPREKIQESEET